MNILDPCHIRMKGLERLGVGEREDSLLGKRITGACLLSLRNSAENKIFSPSFSLFFYLESSYNSLHS